MWGLLTEWFLDFAWASEGRAFSGFIHVVLGSLLWKRTKRCFIEKVGID